ncbi:MAG: hypothetical protein [Circular genetic element sp.]|nr:MAG: hypothetical protein [Circular genetic element sp.]
MTTPTDYIAFMCHTTHEMYDYLEDTLQEYDIGTYFIGYEPQPYEHFHFLVQMTEKDYGRYRKRVFIDKLKLRGKAGDGIARQYGKVSKIEDLEKLKSYTVKEGQFRTNLENTEELQAIVDNSFSKQEKIDREREILSQLHVSSIQEMRYNCIRLCAEIGGNPRPTRSRVDQLVVMKLVEEKKWSKVYEILYGRELTYYQDI